MASAGEQIIYADNADGTTNAVVLFEPVDATIANILFKSAQVPADKFINKNTTTAGDVVDIIILEQSTT